MEFMLCHYQTQGALPPLAMWPWASSLLSTEPMLAPGSGLSYLHFPVKWHHGVAWGDSSLPTLQQHTAGQSVMPNVVTFIGLTR